MQLSPPPSVKPQILHFQLHFASCHEIQTARAISTHKVGGGTGPWQCSLLRCQPAFPLLAETCHILEKSFELAATGPHDLSNSIISYNALQWNDGSSASHQGLLMSWQETQAQLNPRWSQSHPTCGFSGPFPSSRSNSSATDRELLSDGLEAVFETSSGWERHWAIFSRRRSCGCGLLQAHSPWLQKEMERFDLSRATLIFGVSQSAGWLCDIPCVLTLSMKTPDASNRLDFHYQFIPNTLARYISPSHQPILPHHVSSDSKH